MRFDGGEIAAAKHILECQSTDIAQALFHPLRWDVVQARLSKSMSAQRVIAASAGRVMVCNSHSIKQRVLRLILAFVMSNMNSGSSSGGSAGMFSFLGFLNTARIPPSGFAKIIPELTP